MNFIQQDITTILSLIEERSKKLNGLTAGITSPGAERDVLEALLRAIDIEINDETRFAAYLRIGSLKEDGIANYCDKQGFDASKKNTIIARAYDFVEVYYQALHEELLVSIEEQELLTPFYRTLLRATDAIGRAFNCFNKRWLAHIVHDINADLEDQLDGDQDAVMAYLMEHSLFDLGHHGEIADRSYSTLVKTQDGYQKLAYVQAFSGEIQGIIHAIRSAIVTLEPLKDETYQAHDAYISYLRALEGAFSETNTDALVEKWAAVDVAWMAIQTPFQIVHPFEYYEDKYRKAVAPEWEIRIQNPNLFTSNVRDNIEETFSKTADELGIHSDAEVRTFSLASMRRTQLYISDPFLFYGSTLSGLPSAQVIPNDAEVSKSHGKKIFSFAKNVLGQFRSRPPMKITSLAIEEGLRQKRKDIIFGDDAAFYRLYDIETIGHEFGHTLWLESDTEARMNATGNFKNVEEWKATVWGLVAFLENPDESVAENLMVLHITRAISLISWMKLEDLRPYYCEGLIHLKILFDSGMIFRNSEGKITLHFTRDTFEGLRKSYIEHYKDLAMAYVQKKDASIFLSKYTIRENGTFLPSDPTLREFVEWYYKLYEQFGNTVEETAP